MPSPLTLQPQTDKQRWSFVEGPWEEDEQGVITAPPDLGDENLAIYTEHAYGDFEAEYEFRWDHAWTDAGFVFRGRDAQHFYVVQLPCVGQQYRAEHFWAAISKADRTGYLQVLKMEMMHGVTSAVGAWHHARLKVTGSELRLWVDGRPLSVVIDDTFAEPGYVGLYTQSGLGVGDRSSFRNVRVTGQPAPAPPWDDGPQPLHHYGVIDTVSGSGCSQIVRASNGDLIVASGDNMHRSTDNGRTWTSQPTPVPLNLIQVDKDGNLINFNADDVTFKLYRTVSPDHGQTWSDRQQVGEVKFGPDRPYQELVASIMTKLQDGTLLWFFWARTKHERTILEGRAFNHGPVPYFINICLRSDDDGRTWSDWVNIDGPPHDDHQWLYVKDRVSEVSATQTRDGRVIALTRADKSPFIWETWSIDGGRTWTPQARGPFAMYACTYAMCTTTSGYLLIGGRFPALAVQVSRDDGMTWQCYQVDTGIWANGAMIEVEPDVVLFVYGGKNQPQQLRRQLLRVTEDNLEPIAGS